MPHFFTFKAFNGFFIILFRGKALIFFMFLMFRFTIKRSLNFEYFLFVLFLLDLYNFSCLTKGGRGMSFPYWAQNDPNTFLADLKSFFMVAFTSIKEQRFNASWLTKFASYPHVKES